MDDDDLFAEAREAYIPTATIDGVGMPAEILVTLKHNDGLTEADLSEKLYSVTEVMSEHLRSLEQKGYVLLKENKWFWSGKEWRTWLNA